jgi:hypothetical protein
VAHGRRHPLTLEQDAEDGGAANHLDHVGSIVRNSMQARAETKKPPGGGFSFFCWQRTRYKRRTGSGVNLSGLFA